MSKRELIAALAPYVIKKAGLIPEGRVESLDDMLAEARAIFHRSAEMDASLRVVLASELGQELRRINMPGRRAMWRGVIARTAPALSIHDLDRLTNLAVILFSSSTARAFMDFLGLGVDDAADHVIWGLRTLVRTAGSDAGRDDDRTDRG